MARRPQPESASMSATLSVVATRRVSFCRPSRARLRRARRRQANDRTRRRLLANCDRLGPRQQPIAQLVGHAVEGVKDNIRRRLVVSEVVGGTDRESHARPQPVLPECRAQHPPPRCRRPVARRASASRSDTARDPVCPCCSPRPRARPENRRASQPGDGLVHFNPAGARDHGQIRATAETLDGVAHPRQGLVSLVRQELPFLLHRPRDDLVHAHLQPWSWRSMA